MIALRTTYYNDIVCWIIDGCKQKFLDLVNGWIRILIRDKEKRMQNDLLNPDLFGNEAGEDEVRPCDGLQTGRHDKRQRKHGKQDKQYFFRYPHFATPSLHVLYTASPLRSLIWRSR